MTQSGRSRGNQTTAVAVAEEFDKLFDKYGIAAVGFDVVFAERDESSGIRVLERLGQRELKSVDQFQTVLERVRPQLEYDDIFARKMKGRAVVLGHVFLGLLKHARPVAR